MISFTLRSSVLSLLHFALVSPQQAFVRVCVRVCGGVEAHGQQCSWGWGTPSHHTPPAPPLCLFPWCLPRFGALQPICSITQRELPSPGVSSQGDNMGHTWQPSEVTLFPQCSQSNLRCSAMNVTDTGGARLQQDGPCLSWSVLVPDENKAGATGNEAKQHTGR